LSDIKKSKLFPFPVNEEVALRNLFEGILEETELGEISDVLISNPDDGDILQFNESLMVWENVPLPSLPIGNLDDIGDVVITAVADGEVLTWDSGTSQWVNQAPTGGGGTPGGTGTQLQFRNGTDFGGVTGTVWDGTTLTLPGSLRFGASTGAGTRSIVGLDELTVQYDHPTDTGSYARLEMGRTGSTQTSWTLEAVGDGGSETATFTFDSNSTTPEFNGNGLWHAGNLTPVEDLPDLGDVTITSVQDGDVLTYDTGTGQWVNAPPASGGTTAAEDVTYNNTTSGLPATNTQDAIDQVKALADQQVVDGAPTIAQTTWLESFNLTGSDAGFQTSLLGTIINSVPEDRALLWVVNQGQGNNMVGSRSPSGVHPDLRIGSTEYARRYRAAWVISRPQSGVNSLIACGAITGHASSTLGTTVFGLTKDTSNVWTLQIKNQGTDLVTPITVAIADLQNVIVVVETTGDGSTNFAGVKVGVFDFATSALIGKLAWSGTSAGVAGVTLAAWAVRTTPPSPDNTGPRFPLKLLYQAYGPVPSRALNPFFAQL